MKKDNLKFFEINPYGGRIAFCKTLDELRANYEKFSGNKYTFDDDGTNGRFLGFWPKKKGEYVWLVFAESPAALAHEISHVILKTFYRIGHDPVNGDGESFCYMMCYLFDKLEKQADFGNNRVRSKR